MLYGHLDSAYHRIDHLIRLRELQDETGGFQTFIPLAFHPDNTGLAHLKKPSAPADTAARAISPIFFGYYMHAEETIKSLENN